MPSPSCHRRTPSFSNTVSPGARTSRPAADRGSAGAGRPGSAERGSLRVAAPGCSCPRRHARRRGRRTPSPAAARCSSPCRRRCPRRSSRRPASSPPPARSRTGPATSRSPSGSPGRRRARCRRCRPGGRRCSGTGRGSTAHRNCACGCALARSAANFFAGFLFLEDRGDLRRRPRRRWAGSPAPCRSRTRMSLPRLRVDAGAGLLAQRALGDQRLQPLRRLEIAVPRIVGQRVGHGLDDVRHGVEADHVRGAVGRRLRPADQRAGQRIDRRRSRGRTAAVWCIVASIENTPMRLPMKFGVSLARTTPLPSVGDQEASRPSSTAGSVVRAGISSARCM